VRSNGHEKTPSFPIIMIKKVVFFNRAEYGSIAPVGLVLFSLM